MPPNSIQNEDPTQAPNCWQCRYFAISWDPRNPYKCGMMGFKSRMIPSFEVFRADGNHCRGFMDKEAKQPQTQYKATPTAVKRNSRYLWKA
ncbi:MAG: hypothetical protein EBU92_10110 [Betaproteobacteria bacterium]|jgi:hypothetical protein|nr:hypothetical protein [Betaproteobacteria bacterium]